MAADLFVWVRVRWLPEEPDDAAACAACGDVPYLKRWRAWLFINGRRGSPAEWIVCDSCHDPEVLGG